MITALAFVCMANSITVILIAIRVFWSKQHNHEHVADVPNNERAAGPLVHTKEIRNGNRTRG